MALVMFDYDGVIVDSLDVFTSRFSQACQEHGFQDIKEPKDVIGLFEVNVYESMSNRGLDKSTIDIILKRYEALQSKELTGLRLFPSIGDALYRVAENHLVYVITSNLSGATIKVLEQHGIDCFKDVIGADKEKSKIKKIQQLMRLHPELQAFYVGDTKGDMIEGKEAGAKTIAVTWGWHTSDKLKEGLPDFFFNSPKDLADFLEEIR